MSVENADQLLFKRQQLNSSLHERAKGTLVRAQLTTIRDIVHQQASSSTWRDLWARGSRWCVGTITYEPAEMSKHTVSFYMDLFRVEFCDSDAAAELLKGLPKLSPEERDTLGCDFSLEELTTAVSQMSSWKALGMDGLPAEYFKHIWNILGHDLADVF